MTGFLRTLEMASFPQAKWLRSLSLERIAPKEWEYEASEYAKMADDDSAYAAEIITKKQASQMIDAMKAAPKKPVEKPVEIIDGMYILDGEIYKVQHAVHGSGRQYAKKLVADDVYSDDGVNHVFVYMPGIIKRLRPEHKMTLEQAKEFGALYGTCCVCGRTLTRESSIEAGIGPICESKGGW